MTDPDPQGHEMNKSTISTLRINLQLPEEVCFGEGFVLFPQGWFQKEMTNWDGRLVNFVDLLTRRELISGENVGSFLALSIRLSDWQPDTYYRWLDGYEAAHAAYWILKQKALSRALVSGTDSR